MNSRKANIMLPLITIFHYFLNVECTRKLKQRTSITFSTINNSSPSTNNHNENMLSYDFYELLKYSNSTLSILDYLKNPYLSYDSASTAVSYFTKSDDFIYNATDAFDHKYFEEEGKMCFIMLFNSKREGGVAFDDIYSPFLNDYMFKSLFTEFITPLKNMLDEMVKFEEHIDSIIDKPFSNTGESNRTTTKGASAAEKNINSGISNNKYNARLTVDSSKAKNPNPSNTENTEQEYKTRITKIHFAIHKIGVLMSSLLHFTNLEENINLMLDPTVIIHLLQDPNFSELELQKPELLETIQTIKANLKVNLTSTQPIIDNVKQMVNNRGYLDLKKYVENIIFKGKSQINDDIWLILKNEIIDNCGVYNLQRELFNKVDSYFNRLKTDFMSLSLLPTFVTCDILPTFFNDPSVITIKKVNLLCQCISRTKFFVSVFAYSCDIGKYHQTCQELKEIMSDMYKVYFDQCTIKKASQNMDCTALKLAVQEKEADIKKKTTSLCRYLMYSNATIYHIADMGDEEHISHVVDEEIDENNCKFYYLIQYVLNTISQNSSFKKYVLAFFYDKYHNKHLVSVEE